jgi:polysaccharide export outer membrane protein
MLAVRGRVFLPAATSAPGQAPLPIRRPEESTVAVSSKVRTALAAWTLLGACLTGAGCHTLPGPGPLPAGGVPTELEKTPQSPYFVEPPDVLLIDAVRLIPRPPYRVEPLDGLVIRATNVLQEEPIAGLYGVNPDGTVNLGLTYGSLFIQGMTLEEVQEAITRHLRQTFKNVQVSVALGQTRALQQIRGEHLVRPDGTVSLGIYGSVQVAGLTLDRVKAAIEFHLSASLLKPEVSVDVFAYNSKAYYVVTDGGGFGEQVYRIPSTGTETVLDALSRINGLPAVASRKQIWLARPTPADASRYEVFPVDWKAVTRCGATKTNLQVLPGDRIFVGADPLVTLDSDLARFISPIERVLGITLLGNTVGRAVAGQTGTVSTGQ